MRAMLSVKQARGRARAGLTCWRRLLRLASAAPVRRSADVEDVRPNLGQDLGVAATGCPFVQEHLGRHREVLVRDALLPAQLVELPAEVVATPPSDEAGRGRTATPRPRRRG